MTVVKYGSELWALRKADEDFLDVFQTNCLRTVLGTWLTDRISNNRLYEKCGSIPLSRAIMEETLSGKQVVLVWGGRTSIKKDLKEMGTSWAGLKRETLNRLGWRRSVRSCVGLRQLGAAVSC